MLHLNNSPHVRPVAMLIKQFAYPYDPNGTNPACKILAERHTITPINGTNFGFIIPKAAPFFRRSLKLKHVASGRILVDGVDFMPSHHFEAASSQKPYLEIFGSITILDSTITGTLELVQYQTLGGEFTLDETALLEMLANTQLDPRSTTWDKVVYRPLVFDPISHLQSAETTYGYAEMVDVLRLLQENFSTEYSKLALAIANHVQDSSNPHATNTVHLGLERFNNVYRASVEQVFAGHEVNYVVPSTLLAFITATVDTLNMRGDYGQIPYFTTELKEFNVEPDYIQHRLGIVHTPAEWTAQVGARESFAEVFNSWRRIAMTGGNPVGMPSELTGWQYMPDTDSVRSTINSSSLIGLISPEQVTGDYVFEVELSSINTDDDFIGLCLGLFEYGGKVNNLVVLRSASGRSSSPTSRPSAVLYLNQGQPGAVVLGSISNLADAPTGWAGMGVVKLRARRVGTMLYFTTTEPDGPYLPEVSFDLASRPDTSVVLKGANLGYVSYSQTHATWKTLQRTGAEAPVVGLHDGKVAEWDGAGFVVGTKKLTDVILPGRYYRNALTKRMYYGDAAGVPIQVSASAAIKEHSLPEKVNDSVVYTTTDGYSIVGVNISWNSQNLTTGAVTNLGTLSRRNGNILAMMYPNVADTDLKFVLGNGDGFKGGIMAKKTGEVGFINIAGAWLGYFDTNGIFQHSGMNHVSDQRLKNYINYKTYVDDSVISLYDWRWGREEAVLSALRGKDDSGVLAQQVKAIYPTCVSVDKTSGIMSVDYAKLAVHMFLNARLKPTLWQKAKAAVLSLLYK